MTVHNDTADYYRYPDLTPQAEALFEFIRETIEVELIQELSFLTNYDSTKRAIQDVMTCLTADRPTHPVLSPESWPPVQAEAGGILPMLSDQSGSLEQAIREAHVTNAWRTE